MLAVVLVTGLPHARGAAEPAPSWSQRLLVAGARLLAPQVGLQAAIRALLEGCQSCHLAESPPPSRWPRPTPPPPDDGPEWLERIRQDRRARGYLLPEELERLRGVARADTAHPDAQLLLARHYASEGDTEEEVAALQEATRRGRHAYDPDVLLSLARGYAKQLRYGRGLDAMRRANGHLRDMPAESKGAFFLLYAELLERELLRQQNGDPERVDPSLLPRAITQWERYRRFHLWSDPDAARRAEEALARLRALQVTRRSKPKAAPRRSRRTPR